MIKSCCFISLLLALSLTTRPQTGTPDSLHILPAVTVKGFETNRRLLETPASVSFIGQKTLRRFSAASLVPALNTVPGVRMEERSPGSYRLSLRGSLLRSPFGIRNIKIYVDDLPFTDAGGNTYLNLVDPALPASIEILKGPAASLYGAGTGGAVILNTTSAPLPGSGGKQPGQWRAQLTGGSYGLFTEILRLHLPAKRSSLRLTQTHIQSDGYRQNSRLRKDVVQLANRWQLGAKNELKLHALLADLYYQTPGGLTRAQWEADPRLARPATATLPGAVQQKAAIYNKTLFAGVSGTFYLSNKFSTVNSLVASYTGFKNPFITNYEKRNEASRGLRSKWIYSTQLDGHALQLVGGGEWQTTFARINNYGNRVGLADTVQSMDEVNAYQHFYFAQAGLALHQKVFIDAGISYNAFTYRYLRTAGKPAYPRTTKKFDPVLSPRLAILYKPAGDWSLRMAISKGFSTPTIAEVRPSEGSFFQQLQPEYGWNYEAGARAQLWQQRLQLDMAVYSFNLRDAIVRRLAANGGEYFINAGGTRQTGLEAVLGYTLLKQPQQYIHTLRIWTSYTFNDYHFRNYVTDSTNYSGQALTGVPKTVLVAGLDVEAGNGFYLNGTYNSTARLPLNDANTFYAAGYHLLQAKLGCKGLLKKKNLEVFIGADNILNEHYSLGNDINAVGNRFFNAALPRNYFAGVEITW